MSLYKRPFATKVVCHLQNYTIFHLPELILSAEAFSGITDGGGAEKINVT